MAQLPKLTFFPLGNADCCLIDLQNDKKVLFDYAVMRDTGDRYDKRIDLPRKLRRIWRRRRWTRMKSWPLLTLMMTIRMGPTNFFTLIMRQRAKAKIGSR